MTASNGLLLINLGSPEAPTTPALRRYLGEFLSDPRVMDIPPLTRSLLLRLVILPRRPQKVAPKYQSIWTEAGSPLVAYGQEIQKKISQSLGVDWQVELAMRYGHPSLIETLERLKKSSLKRLVVLPLFPQYASATSGSAIEAVMEQLGSWPTLPDLLIKRSFHDHPAFLDAFANRGRVLWQEGFDHLVFSFHGLPEHQILKSDASGHCLQSPECCAIPEAAGRGCYRAQCFATARELAHRLEVPMEQYSVVFQSRLGRAKWLEPSLNQELERLSGQGIKRLLVYSPSFVADCLETLEEIAQEGAKQFKALGGERLQLVPSLNDGADWAEALVQILRELAP
ncbi:MAG: ferrochelatase [bacterium]|nr:ferrochelatase [bacterium]